MFSNGNLPSSTMTPVAAPGPGEFEFEPVHTTDTVANEFGTATHHGTTCPSSTRNGRTFNKQLADAPFVPNSASVTVQPQFHLDQPHGDRLVRPLNSNQIQNQLQLTPSELDEILWSFTDQTVYSTPWPDDPGPGPVTPLTYSSDSNQVSQTHSTTNSTTDDVTATAYSVIHPSTCTTRFHDPHISSTNNNVHTHRPSWFLLPDARSTSSTTDTIPPAAAFELNSTRGQLPSHPPFTNSASVGLSSTTSIPGPPIVLGALGVNSLPSIGLLPKTSLPRPTIRASTACMSCRKLKVACDNQRPCSRCANKGRECLRSDQEIKSNPLEKVKKRPISSLTTPITKTTVAAAVATLSALSPAPSPLKLLTKIPVPTPTCNQTPDSTFDLWSHSYLTLLTQMDVRDTILKLNAKFDSLPVDLPTILHWHTQISFMCCHFSEQMSDQDFRTFLTQGLSSEILNSRLWTSSPFAPWATFSTRPFFTIHATLAPGEETLPNNHPSKIQSDTAELYFEFAPSSNKGFARFLEMQTARIMFERQLSNGRIRKLNTSNNNHNLQTTSNSSSHPSANSTHALSSNSSSAASTTDMVDLHVNGVDNPDSRLMAPLFESLAKLSLFDFPASLSAPPPTHIIEDENKYAEFHARWCPMSPAAASSATNANHSADMNKLKRTNWIDSVHGSTKPISKTNLDHIPLADLLSSDHTSFRCICSSSTPLPATIRINPGFERLFGWRRIEVEQQFQLEGSSWLRHLSPISSYAAQHRYWINHFKSHIIAMGEMALQAAAAYSNQLESQQSTLSSMFGGVIDQPPLPPVPVSELEPWFSQTCRIRRKSGEIDPHLYHQRCTIQPSDGQTKPTTTTIRWNKLEKTIN